MYRAGVGEKTALYVSTVHIHGPRWPSNIPLVISFKERFNGTLVRGCLHPAV